ncbi:FxLYD domain-containing protein [Streptomyces sp. NPDC005989]|uniref:FxLYD domain-containing protein n=1 Tax=Streptomyces sp. NPDC005989 TaxID=3156727 RepID=UPI0033C71A93
MSQGYPPSDQHPQWGGRPPQQQYQQWPQQQGPGWGAPLPPPKKSRTGLIVTLSVLGGLVMLGGCGVLVAAVAGSGGTIHESSASGSSRADDEPEKNAPGKSEPAEKPAKEKPAKKETGPEADVKVTGCTVNSSTTWPAADVEIVNHSEEKSNYIVSVEFVNSAGDRLGEGMAATNNLAPGQKSVQKAQGLDATSGKVTCKVTDVSRYPSP